MDKCKIPDIFEKMEYGENIEKMDKLNDWLRTKESGFFTYIEKSSESPNGVSTKLNDVTNDEPICTVFVPEIDVIKTILSRSTEKDNLFDRSSPIDRCKKLNRLAEEIEKNADLFAQIEAVTRGILIRSTKSTSVPDLAQLFSYYSAFSVKHNLENPQWKPQGIAAAIISNENPLTNLGLFLAPALAAGYNVVLQVGVNLCLSAFLLCELATKAGLPEDAIRVIPSDDGELLPYLSCDKVSILTLFVDLKNDKYRGINSLNKKILCLSSCQVPVMIFEGADLDSAAEGILDSAWSGKSGWPVNTVLIQENIFPLLAGKLKDKIKTLNVGSPLDRMSDIPERYNQQFTKHQKTITLAQSQGLEFFQRSDGENKWSPTLIIGGRIGTSNVLHSTDEFDESILTLLAFRTIDEAVNLANNTKQGIGASLWCENIGIINEVSRKLKVSNVWVNSSYGLTASDVGFTPLKESGRGWFGGAEGFYEYVQISKNATSTAPSLDQDVPYTLNNSIISKINSAKKAQESWNKLGYVSRKKILQKFAESTAEAVSNDIFLSIVNSNDRSGAACLNGYVLTSFRNPLGVIALEKPSVCLLITALYNGNAVLLLDDSPSGWCKDLSQKLPAGILSIIPNNVDVVKTVASHNEMRSLIGLSSYLPSVVPLRDSANFVQITSNNEDCIRNVTFNKNVWCDIGKSNTFN